MTEPSGSGEGRASIFGDEPALDLEGFAPKPRPAVPPHSPDRQALREIAEAERFVSREPARSIRRHRTGPNIQLNVKVRRETLEQVHRIADAEGWVLGEVLEHALAALQRERGQDQDR